MSDNSQEQFDSAAGEEPDSVATKQIDSSAAGPVGANGDAVSGTPKLTLPAVPVTSKLFLWRRRLPQIAQWEPTLQAESQAQLRKRSLSLRYRARSGEKLDSLVPEAFALVSGGWSSHRRNAAFRRAAAWWIGDVSRIDRRNGNR